MTKRVSRLVLVGSVLALMCLPSLAMAHSHDYLFNSGSRYVRLEPNRVVIKGDAAKRAVIGKTGTLQIGRVPVAVSVRDQKYLASYYEIAFDLRDQAKNVAEKAVGDAFKTVGDVLGAVFTGADSAEAEAAEQKKLRQSVHADIAPLCQKITQLKTLQDKVALDVPAFKPYAILKRSDVTDCRN